jgi:hypothetical protein
MSAETCPTCGEEFYPGQKYYAAPYKEHVMCRKYKEEFMLVGALMYERYLRQEKDKQECLLKKSLLITNL